MIAVCRLSDKETCFIAAFNEEERVSCQEYGYLVSSSLLLFLTSGCFVNYLLLDHCIIVSVRLRSPWGKLLDVLDCVRDSSSRIALG